MVEDGALTIQALKLLRPLVENPADEFAGIDLIRASGVATGTAYPIMLRLERQGVVSSRWEDGDPHELGRPRRRYYSITRKGASRANQALRELAEPFALPVVEAAS